MYRKKPMDSILPGSESLYRYSDPLHSGEEVIEALSDLPMQFPSRSWRFVLVDCIGKSVIEFHESHWKLQPSANTSRFCLNCV